MSRAHPPAIRTTRLIAEAALIVAFIDECLQFHPPVNGLAARRSTTARSAVYDESYQFHGLRTLPLRITAA